MSFTIKTYRFGTNILISESGGLENEEEVLREADRIRVQNVRHEVYENGQRVDMLNKKFSRLNL